MFSGEWGDSNKSTLNTIYAIYFIFFAYSAPVWGTSKTTQKRISLYILIEENKLIYQSILGCFSSENRTY